MNETEMHIAAEILRLAEDQNLSIQKLSIKASIPYTTMRRRILGGGGFTVMELLRIAAVLDVNPSELIPAPKADEIGHAA